MKISLSYIIFKFNHKENKLDKQQNNNELKVIAIIIWFPVMGKK